ncbi:uncharacterized protein LOC114302018 [Camellia sinensis]|uniref:uncharacterized protein LOC114302018 n=1 Tax=Camellia sinensis TaxID=4442 RepID=UPI00103622A1|nr:uncharacterized protein LOC114302018 [Camellia sinensis]
MSWNVRGLGKLEKKGRIRKLIYERKADVVLFQETKKVSISECEVRASRGRRNMDFMVVGSNGTAGGLLCIWDPDFFQLVDCCSNRRFILLSGTLLHTFNYTILNMYAPNEVSSRCKFWDSLMKLKSAFPNPWCLRRNLNEIRNIGERVGCSRRDKGIIDLNSFIESCELNDLPLLGKRDWGPKPFRFINAWTIYPSFPSLLERVWQEARINGRAGYALFQKLKLLKVELKKWNAEVFGNLSAKLKKAEEELVALNILAESRPLVEVEKIERRAGRGEVWKLSRLVEWLWQQKSRVKWTINGDKNTKFFHVMASSKRSRNAINSITVKHEVFEEPAKVKYEVLQHFKRQFSESWVRRPVLGGLFNSVQSSSVFHDLEAVFSEDKVRAAVKECNGDKAPGLDGFNLLFFQKLWGSVHHEAMNFLRDFHATNRLPYGINSSFITLVPKTDNPLGLSYYRPISLVGSLYKILSKVLAHRLKRVLPVVIGETQSAFLGGGESVVYGVGVDEETLASFADTLNCKVHGLPLKFLGLPLGANPGRKSTWKPVLDKVRSRLAGWKRRLISFAGRLTLIKFVLYSLPNYYLSMFKMPSGVAREIERLEASFLWGGNDLKRKAHLKFGCEVNALWRRLLCSKYMIKENNWIPPVSSSSRYFRIWRDVLAIAGHNQPLEEFYLV